MRSRCYNQNNPTYQRYGARGITVCERWKTSFVAFLEDMGRRPSLQHSLDRSDNSLGYSRENCRWATAKDQSRNRRSNRFIVVAGIRRTLAEWGEVSGLGSGVIHARLKAGWCETRAVLQAKKACRRR